MSNVSDNISNISDDNVDDDVFEGVAITQKRLQDNLGKVNENYNEEMTMTMMIRPRGSRLCGDGAITKTVDISHRSNNNNTIIQTSTITTAATAATITTTTSSAASRSQSQTLSGYSSCRPSREALQLFALKDINYDRYDYDYDDGWRSYHYDEVGMISTPPPIIQPIHKKPFDDTVNHKTILLGDSGVGKTSFLVKYNTGEFRLGSFSATVGIALTVIMLGDSGVGKTSLLIMYRDGIYMPCYYVTTVGIDFMNKVVIVDGTRVKLQIWDTAGQERFRSVTHAYYRDAHALLLMYDVTNKLTYDNIRAWLCEIRDCAQEDVVIVLIGNKADCSNNDRQVKREDGERLAREHNVPFMETSAKNGQNVELAFQTVARQLKNRGHEQNDEGKFNIHEFVRDNTKAKTMCAQCNL